MNDNITMSLLDQDLNNDVSYQDFLKAFGYGIHDTIYLRQFYDPENDPDQARNREVSFSGFDAILPALRDLESKKYGTFFVVNGGGHKKKAVKVARAQFIDIDDYGFEEQIKMLREFPLEASIVVKTAKSLHAYWLLDDGDIRRFRNIQNRLIKHFGSDPRIKDEPRVMRLYGFKHQKAEPVMVKLIKFDPDLRYTQDQLCEVLPEVKEEQEGKARQRAALPERISEGGRNDAIFRLASLLQNKGLDDGSVLAACKAENEAKCEPPLSESEVEACVNSALKYEKGSYTDASNDGKPVLYEPIDSNPEIYTADSFRGTDIYERLYRLKARGQEFAFVQESERLATIAANCGVPQFKTKLNAYCKEAGRKAADHGSKNEVDIDGLDIVLDSGRWIVDENGVRMVSPSGEVSVACVHPIVPVKRLINVDTGNEKLEIAYKRAGRWRKKTFDRHTLANSKSIVALSDYGIAVTSENAKLLVTYLHDIESTNYMTIEEMRSVARLGWISRTEFSPYVDGIVFDGDDSFLPFFRSVQAKGETEEWISFMSEIRSEGNIPVRILLAASFASVLVDPCNSLPFFVHIWGPTGNGKTVALMTAASVWADPSIGQYIHTFNSTDVGQEMSAGFVNSMPLVLDEFQIQKDKRVFDKQIYKLSEGVGRTRGSRNGGVKKTPTWRNCIITSGESPITSSRSGGGAVNRIIEIEAQQERLFEDPVKVAAFLREHYGTGGRLFVEKLMADDGQALKDAREMQQTYYADLAGRDITDKQAMAASLLLAADTLIEEYIFQDGRELSVDDVRAYLATNKQVSANYRALLWLEGWIAQNSNRFYDPSSSERQRNKTWEYWGKVVLHEIWIIKTVFEDACQDAGFDPKSFLTYLRDQGFTKTDPGALTKRQRINDVKTQCVIFKLPETSTGPIDMVATENEGPF